MYILYKSVVYIYIFIKDIFILKQISKITFVNRTVLLENKNTLIHQ